MNIIVNIGFISLVGFLFSGYSNNLFYQILTESNTLF